MPLLASEATDSVLSLCPSFSKNRTKTMVELCTKFVESVEFVEFVAVVQQIGAQGFFKTIKLASPESQVSMVLTVNREVGDIKVCVYTQ